MYNPVMHKTGKNKKQGKMQTIVRLKNKK